MSYGSQLQKRLRDKRLAKKGITPKAARRAAEAAAPAPIVHDAETLAAIGAVHPSRYPKHHDPAKGQLLGGECNTTRCHNQDAVFFNRGTYGLYCVTCARGHNWRGGVPLSILVDEKPASTERMEEMRREMHAAMRASGQSD